MSETRIVHDPFLGKPVEISSRLIDRLRGRYACGPTMANGEPEFGWREFEVPPIQHEAAAEIEQLMAENARLSGGLIAITGAPKTVGSIVLRSVAYDIALNCLDPSTAAFQIERRAGIRHDDEQQPQEAPLVHVGRDGPHEGPRESCTICLMWEQVGQRKS